MTYLTASEEVLLAGNKLYTKGNKIFTEWELTIETWKLNKQRWGLKGYEEKYPDHKRVMNEIMSKGHQKVLGKGWFIRVKENHYSITPLGLSQASSLSKFKVTKKTRNRLLYEQVFPYLDNRVSKSHCQDPDEPKTWLGVAAFLRLTKNDPDMLDKNLRVIKTNIHSALSWLEENNEPSIRKDDSSKPVSKEQLHKLEEFLEFIEKKFKKQFESIRSKK